MSAPPQAIEAERAVLGAVLSGARIEDLTDVLAGADFWEPRHELIWTACLAVARQGGKPDAPLVAGKLGSDLTKVGGASYLAGLLSIDAAPHPGQARRYAAEVAEAATRRRLRTAAVEIIERADKSTVPAAELAEDARGLVDRAAAGAAGDETGVGWGPLLAHMIEHLDEELDAGQATDWCDLDDITGPIRPGMLLIVGARPGVGKSVITANLAGTWAARGIPVHLASLEMSRDEVMARMAAAACKVDLGRLLNHTLRDDDWTRLGALGQQDWPLWVDDSPGQSLAQLRARARTTKRQHDGLGLIVVDYLQLLRARDPRAPRQEQVAEMSRGLKELGKELGCVVVAAAQLNRQGHADGKPRMSDLRESGQIEQDADVILLLDRTVAGEEGEDPSDMTVIVEKNRHGNTGVCHLRFQGMWARCVNATL